jgi:hypothetical protein
MIIEIKVANYRSINAEQTFSFVAENAARHKDNLIPRKGYKLLKAAALFGANASGKSNLVKAIGAMRDFVRDSATRMNDGDHIGAATPFRLDPDAYYAPSRFEITFLMNDMLYTYGFAADTKRVYEEWLKAEPEGGRVETFGFQRTYDAKSDTYVYDCRGTLKPVADLLRDRTRSNALMLSTGSNLNVPELLAPYHLFQGLTGVFDMPEGAIALISYAAKRCKEDASLLLEVETLLRSADTGIDTIRVEDISPGMLPRASMGLYQDEPNLNETLRAMIYSATWLRIVTTRKGVKDVYGKFDFGTDESSGTQRLFALAVLFLDVLTSGGFVVIDELDASMHPLLSRKLLELFQSTHANPNGAQLLFTTHDPSLLNQVLFRRDQVWLAEKRDGASTFFSLADVEPRPRNTEAFLRNYLSGRYGGTPHLGRAFDTLRIGAAK